MKRFFGILNLILCFELIIGPHFPGTRVFSLEVAKAETCPSGLVFDSTLNRCITSDQQATIINATASCNGDRECYKRLAEEQLKKAEEEGKIAETVKNKGGLMSTAGQIAAIAGPLTVIMGAFRSKKCMNASGIAMIAGGVAFTAGNFMANKKHKSCLKKIRKDWEAKKKATTEKTSSGTNKVSMSQDQSEAFEMLAKSEECMEKSAKMKAGFYAASTLAFGASAVIAMMEVIKPGTAPSCTNKPDPAAGTEEATGVAEDAIEETETSMIDKGIRNGFGMPDSKLEAQIAFNIQTSSDISSLLANSQVLTEKRKSCASIDDYEKYKNAFEGTGVEEDHSVLEFFKMAYQGLQRELAFVNTAHAEPEAAAAIAEEATEDIVVIAKKPVAKVVKTDLIDKMNTPMARAIISGVLTGLSAMMWMHANKQAKVAKNRAEFLRNLKKEFNEATGAISCTAEERNISANANCYCYTEAGQRNSARANSQVCQQLFTGKSLAQAGNYDSLDFSNERVCIASSGVADINCACKATKNCLNAIPGTAGNLGLGAISVASNGMKPVNDLANGSIGAGSINGVAALSSAARLLDKKKELENKARLDPNKQKKLAADFEKSIMTAAAGMPNSGSSSSSSFPMNMTAADAAKALEKELGNSGSDFGKINGSPALAQPGNSAVEDSGFTIDTPSPAATTESQLAEAMAQDLNYGQSDITKSDTSLFNILSNRYQRSGMRRLFDEEGKSSPQPSNKTDISK